MREFLRVFWCRVRDAVDLALVLTVASLPAALLIAWTSR